VNIDLTTTFGFVFALVLLLLIFIRALLAVSHHSGRMGRILDLIIVPLVIVFLVVAFVRYVELSTPPLAPTPGPNPTRLVPSVSPLGDAPVPEVR
jgi:hypothetical protein